MGERVHRSVMNIKVGMFFYILSLFLAFFSRKVFLDCLGAEFIGLTGMLMNIMSFLSVAELGIGTSIVYFLYKPLQEDNHEKINEVMSMLAYLYRCIGFTIGGLGIIVSLFFPWWFGNLTTGLPLVYFAFYSFLATTVSAYVFNFKQLLVSANQKQYLVQAYFQTTNIVQSLTQILLAYYYRNLWLWVVVGLVFTIIGIIVFNIRIRQLYPWLDINLKAGRENLKRYPEVLKKTRQVFILKIKDFILNRSDEILVGAFVSVTRVAFYGNYTIILNKIIYLVNILADGMSAGIGNLLAEGDERNRIIDDFSASKRKSVLVGASIKDGVDFKGDICRFQIMFKIPYPQRNELVNYRMEQDRSWYFYQAVMAIMQAYGRGIRDMDDYCTMYIIDSSFEYLFNYNRRFFNKYFEEAVIEAIKDMRSRNRKKASK